MTYHTTVYLSDDHKIWIVQMSLNVSKYVKSLIDKDMAKWKDITEKALQPIVDCEQELDESQYHEVRNKHKQIPD